MDYRKVKRRGDMESEQELTCCCIELHIPPLSRSNLISFQSKHRHSGVLQETTEQKFHAAWDRIYWPFIFFNLPSIFSPSSLANSIILKTFWMTWWQSPLDYIIYPWWLFPSEHVILCFIVFVVISSCYLSPLVFGEEYEEIKGT